MEEESCLLPLEVIPVWRWSGRRNDPGLLLLLPHGHDLLLLLGQTLHFRLQEAQRRVEPLNGAGVICKVDFSRSHTCITATNIVMLDLFCCCESKFELRPYSVSSPPPSSQGDLGAAPSGLHLSARSMLPRLLSNEGVVDAGEGVSAPPELGLTGAVTPFLLTTFRKAVLPIF